MGQGSDGDGEAREEATEDEDEKTAELQTSKETDEHRSNEARSEHSASNTANLFSKTDTNENLCNKNTPSPPATIWKQILHYSSALPRKPSITHGRERESLDQWRTRRSLT